MLRLVSIVLAALLVSVPTARAFDDAKDKAKPDTETTANGKAALDALRKEVQDAAAPFIEKFRAAKTEPEKVAIREEFNVKSATYAVKFLAIAEKYPKDPAAFEALIQTVVIGRQNEAQAIDKAVAILLKDFADDPRAQGIHLGIASSDGPGVEKFLRSALQQSTKPDVQGQAALGLARHLKGRYERATAAKKPEAEQLGKEAENHFQLVTDKYAGVKAGGESLGDAAKAELFEMKFLSLGRVAPETQGEDIEGKKFKLSDYRGKVVVIDFWASWCGPCMAMVPHNREMVKHMKGKPFILLGVNLDGTKEACKKAAEEKEINWRSWFDGQDGPISKQYNIQSIPTIYVLDHKGVIRHKGLRGEELERAVEVLVKEAETQK